MCQHPLTLVESDRSGGAGRRNYRHGRKKDTDPEYLFLHPSHPLQDYESLRASQVQWFVPQMALFPSSVSNVDIKYLNVVGILIMSCQTCLKTNVVNTLLFI